MDVKDLAQLINPNKRIDSVKKPVKRLFKIVIWKYTGRSILKTIESYTTGLKQDLEVIFKPAKKFNKNDLKGVDTSTLLVTENDQDQRGTHTLQDNVVGYKEKPSKVTKGNFAKEEEFVNWFDLTGNREKPVENTKCTYTDKYGNTVSLDESYESLKRDSD